MIKSSDHRPVSIVSFVTQIAEVIEHSRSLQHVFQSVYQKLDLGNGGPIVITSREKSARGKFGSA